MTGRLVLVDKPEGPTSHDVVATLRRTLGVRKAGHCGTLDPLASGLLLILTGWATRLAEVFSGHDKLYQATVRFGTATSTDDCDGEVIARREDVRLEAGAVGEALADLAAARTQRPPRFSAIKMGGVPLYKLARRGEAPDALPERPAVVHRLALTALREREADLEIHCGAGYYVRALARDLGDRLGAPAHLAALRRLRSGPFTVADAVPADRLLWEDSAAPLGLDLAAALAHLPAAGVREQYRELLVHGRQPGEGDLDWAGALPAPGSWLRLVDSDGALLALGRVEADPEPVLRLRRSLPR
ncbi:MAG: tRNA pseudouridine(55) synthase TruB [Candidatus Krumholzibacteriota bacterium]|nr:tRNA pseudouridine(55) synthase TruB [Candidatus Krumholzibacteriota bacterium]